MEFNLFSLVLAMLAAGFGSFGGGVGALNIMKDFAINSNWIENEMEFLYHGAFAQAGGYAQGIIGAAYLGGKLGIIGTVLGVIAYILPSVLIVIVLLKLGERFYKNKNFVSSLKYINLLSIGLIAVIFYNYVVTVFGIDPIIYIAVAGIACYVNIFLDVSPGIIILGGAIVGAIWRA